MKRSGFWHGGPALAAALILFSKMAVCSGFAAEAWTDERLPVREGLAAWFDASKQAAGRGATKLAPINNGDFVDTLLDGSGNRHHLSQPVHAFRPRFLQSFIGAFVEFDGTNDFLWTPHLEMPASEMTVFLFGTAFTNQGGFRGFFAINQHGRNDYQSGVNLDLGSFSSPKMVVLNAEGAGFTGADSLLPQGAILDFGRYHVFNLEIAKSAVRLRLDGTDSGNRYRVTEPIQADELVLGARNYSNNSREPVQVQGFLRANLCEVLVYNRLLSAAERQQVESYLAKKYEALRQPGNPFTQIPKANYETVTNPPPLQFFLPGFVARELPVELVNLNNLRYRPDGKLAALGYNGHIYLLSDSDGDGLEDRVTEFWNKDTLRAPIGMALTPPGYARGNGMFVAAKGKLSLIVDTNGDDQADQEIVVAEGWKELMHGVDALGVAVDRDGSVYFGLGSAAYTEPYQVDKTSDQSMYSLSNERGTILKVSPDFKTREIFCTGIRFPVGMAFNRSDDLFCTDQEGATWVPNGNPFDELLHIQKGRHYGFPAQHPKYLPNVIDEPSVFDYAPQHESTCGLYFNDGAQIFGPADWRDNAFVAGYSRGKVYRTALVKTPAGYVAKNHLIATLNALTVEAVVTPQGSLLVETHSGRPDWGSGPNGKGKLYKVDYVQREIAQPVLAFFQSPGELRVQFDRPLDRVQLKELKARTRITAGKYVATGDRFETVRPGYQVVFDQMSAPRMDVPVYSAETTPDLRNVVLKVPPALNAINYSIHLPRFGDTNASVHSAKHVPQHPDMDVGADLTGLLAEWKGSDQSTWTGWLPHLNRQAAQAFTRGSAMHETFWPLAEKPGRLTLKGKLDLWQMLQPAIQPGSKLNYERPPETVSVHFAANSPFTVRIDGKEMKSSGAGKSQQVSWTTVSAAGNWIPFELEVTTGAGADWSATWSTSTDARERAFPLRRILLPWVTPADPAGTTESHKPPPELTGGNWLRGKKLFFGETAGCSKCHQVGGQGGQIGPDLSNLVHRDYESVLRDIREPSAAINPDFAPYRLELEDGDSLTALIRGETSDAYEIADGGAKSYKLPKQKVKKLAPSAVSIMPEGLLQALKPDELKDLLTFLMTAPVEPASAK